MGLVEEKREKRKIAKRKYDRLEKGKLQNRKYKLMKVYGITIEDYDNLLESQNGVCAICKNIESHKTNGKIIDVLSVDHNHDTGKVRGILCHECNSLLGLARDNIEILEKAIKYLKGELS